MFDALFDALFDASFDALFDALFDASFDASFNAAACMAYLLDVVAGVSDELKLPLAHRLVVLGRFLNQVEIRLCKWVTISYTHSHHLMLTRNVLADDEVRQFDFFVSRSNRVQQILPQLSVLGLDVSELALRRCQVRKHLEPKSN